MLQSMVTDALGTKALDGYSLKLHLLLEADRPRDQVEQFTGPTCFFGSKFDKMES